VSQWIRQVDGGKSGRCVASSICRQCAIGGSETAAAAAVDVFAAAIRPAVATERTLSHLQSADGRRGFMELLRRAPGP
jgi:hypothetical protein